MEQHDVDAIFNRLTAPIEEELDQRKTADFAYRPETRPIPEGLIPRGLPLGHIALQGDFKLHER